MQKHHKKKGMLGVGWTCARVRQIKKIMVQAKVNVAVFENN